MNSNISAGANFSELPNNPGHTVVDSQADSSTEVTLQPQLSTKWALTPVQLMGVVFLALVFLLFSYLPLRGTDLWGHIEYGNWIQTNGRLPLEDPFMPLARGMHVVDANWLSQILLAKVDAEFGLAGLSTAFAIVSLLTLTVLLRAFYLTCGRFGPALTGTAVCLALGWSRLGTIRPESMAMLLMALLLWLLLSRQRAVGSEGGTDQTNGRRWPVVVFWLTLPALFVLWANLHGSYVCGLAVLACFALGRGLEVLWRERHMRALLEDRGFRHLTYSVELAAIATLVNPYGIDLWLHTLNFGTNPNLASIVEWQPLYLLGPGGREFALSWPVLALILRWSRRRLPPAHVLLLALFSVATVLHVRMLSWYAVTYGLLITPQLADIAARVRAGGSFEGETQTTAHVSWLVARSWRNSLLALLVIWLGFSLSPASQPVLGGKPRSADQLLGEDTPRALTEYLNKNPVEGQMFHPQYWGDWLVRTGVSGQVFTTSHVHLVPPRVWRDYLQVFAVRPGWNETLDRYNVRTILADPTQQGPLIRILRRDAAWQVAYEHPEAVVFVRKQSATASKEPA